MIGIDLVENKRIEKALKDDAFIKRILTKCEIDYVCSFKNKIEHVAGFFACKEAVMKALDNCKEIAFKDIEIKHKETGKPYVVLYGRAKDVFDFGGYSKIEISISQTENFATAVAWIEK